MEHLNFPFPSLIVVLFLLIFPFGICNDLSRCCAGGSRHFREHGNCQTLRAAGSTPTCSRSASICCLRALIDASCQAGVLYAQRHKVCGTVIVNELAGGTKRECCDCCLLAGELSQRGEMCAAPKGFSPDCLNSFTKCCNRTEGTSQQFPTPMILSQPYQSVSVSIGPESRDLTCENPKCEHLCSVREEGTVQCSCRPGYDLAPDGRSCADIDECELFAQYWHQHDGTRTILALLPTTFKHSSMYGNYLIKGMPICDLRRELCVNTVGGYGCRPLATKAKAIKEHKMIKNQRLNQNAQAPKLKLSGGDRFGYQTNVQRLRNGEANQRKRIPPNSGKRHGEVNECANFGHWLCSEFNTQCLNSEGAFSCVCSPGFYWSDRANVCVDIDECLLLADDCAESQRCLNTPGGFKCIRTQSCGTGYAMDSETEQCVDVDECTLGAHDCGPMYQCRNTQGSFRCVPKRCAPDEVMDPNSGQCKSMNCHVGYKAIDGRCEDIDECREQPRRCALFEECVNIPGSFRCQEQGNVCSNGYYMDKDSGFCLDIDECSRSHTCESDDQCMNLPGTFRCNCGVGFEFNELTMHCEDVDECAKLGSYECLCKAGFKLGADNRSCDDMDECATGVARCQQKCINSPGSYQCICDRGYQLGIDESTCEDIDECEIWAKSGNELCMGQCVNVPGSFVCTCPLGYELMADGITCKDIDECRVEGICAQGHLCVNLLGNYRCQRIECPRNYFPDRNYKNRCVKRPGFCENLALERCKKLPIHISWQHIAIPKQLNISLHRTSVTLFSMKGPNDPNSTMQFELSLISASPVSGGSVTAATRANFLLQKGENRNSAIIALRDSLDGPQEVQLELVLRLSLGGVFSGKYVANLLVFVSQHKAQPHHPEFHRQNGADDTVPPKKADDTVPPKKADDTVPPKKADDTVAGWIPEIDDGFSCLKECHATDARCLSNFTREILFQFRSIPSVPNIKKSIEISQITTDLNRTLSVEYSLNGRNAQHFTVEQQDNSGIVKLIEPIHGPQIIILRLHITVKSLQNVALAHNLALIEVHVASYHF
uniref:EGF-like domain-containing protein n=1 Tax=Globodera rostochiensis TaxID=31243 RepID=A0A914HZ30_GLORO